MPSPLASLEPRLRHLLPADLYAQAWLDPTPATLARVFDHLRTLHHILQDYVPRQLIESPPEPGDMRFEWQQGTLIFTDLAGFTPLMEASVAHGASGADILLTTLNAYFSEMLAIISRSGGNLLEFTGDAVLVQFPFNARRNDAAQAVRAALRMQRAMRKFENIETSSGVLKLGMRIGVHTGRFLSADIGTPRRMGHVLLGAAVLRAKHAEGAGQVGRVNLTAEAYERVRDLFRAEPGQPGHLLVIDDLDDKALGEYDLALGSRRPAAAMLLDRSLQGVLGALDDALHKVEPLACYLPATVLQLVVNSASARKIPPDFPRPTILFVNLIGLSEGLETATGDEQTTLVNAFSHLFARINAIVETRGGVLKNVTYHTSGSDMLIMFGTPVAHTDDSVRALNAALSIRDLITTFKPPSVRGRELTLSCQLGLSVGPVFAAEVGEQRGRREFNVLGDAVNTAARLMGRAVGNRILLTQSVYEYAVHHFDCKSLGVMPLKGKAIPTRVYELRGRQVSQP